MPHPLTDHLSLTPIHAPCAVRVGGHSFGFGAQFFPIQSGRPAGQAVSDLPLSVGHGLHVSNLNHRGGIHK